MKKGIKKGIFGVTGLILCLLLAINVSLDHFAAQPLQLQEPGQLFVVDKGITRKALAKRLYEVQLLSYVGLFTYYIQLHPELSHFKAGMYRLSEQMTLKDFLELINSGKEAQFSVQFVEGTRAGEWLAKLQKAPWLQHTFSAGSSQREIGRQLGISSPSIEGWFYPDTYQYTAMTTDTDILTRAYRAMQKELTQVWESREPDLPYKKPYDLLIMASLIEKETGIENERKLIASVFINRLKRNMRLQSDPTVIYGLGKDYSGTLRHSDLQKKTPYNTYIITGLPPTPIAMPGMASLDAAAHPAQTDYLYFVANGENGHQFSTNLADHNKAVQDYIKTRQKSSQ